MITPAFAQLCSWENLVLAWRKAARGKRGTASVARFEYRAEEHLADLREHLLAGSYRLGAYVHFLIKDPKRRRISAIRFRDRVVHHALCTIIEPRFERLFVADSYANRKAKGTHRAVDRLQAFARRYRYVLRADIVQHFASVDHAILLAILTRQIPEADVMGLVETIVASGRGVLDDEYRYVRFSGRRPARHLPAARAADRQSHLAVLVQLLPAPLRSVRDARTRLPRLFALRR